MKVNQMFELTKQIKQLEEQLNSTDYQIIKCYEYSLNNRDLPYDVEKLHSDRQILRDRINELREQMKNSLLSKCETEVEK